MRRESTLLVVGGHGGHAAVAVTVAAVARRHGLHPVLVGESTALFQRLAPRGASFAVAAIADAGIARPRTVAARLSRLRVPLRTVQACRDARALVDATRPVGVVALGGAAAGIVALAAARRGVPVVVHEQNAVAGRGTRLALRVATSACAAFDNVVEGGVEGAVVDVVPVPVRAAFEHAAAAPRPRARRVVVIGGSGGSAALNAAVQAALPQFRRAGIRGVWCGVDVDEIGDAVDVFEPVRWVDNLAATFASADVIVTAAGAVSLAEAAAVRRACVVLPRHDVAADHQRKNAHALAARGALVHANARTLADDVCALVDDDVRADAYADALATWAGRDGNGTRADPAARLLSHVLARRA